MYEGLKENRSVRPVCHIKNREYTFGGGLDEMLFAEEVEKSGPQNRE
jgi:hypothetical protein